MNSLLISQNNIKSSDLVKRLIDRAKIPKDAIVLDIGAGKGIITSELVKISDRVIAIELDKELANLLKSKFPSNNVSIINEDFINYKLPFSDFYVFSNIPFNRSSDIVRSLLTEDSNLIKAYLVTQREFALKIGGHQLNSPSTLMSIIYGTSYTISIDFNFHRHDFDPSPSVDSVLLKIERRFNQKLLPKELHKYHDFVSYLFNKSIPKISNSHLFTTNQWIRFKKEIKVSGTMKPSELSIDQLIQMYKIFLTSNHVNEVDGYYKKILKEQSNIQKVHRTRTDPKWKSY